MGLETGNKNRIISEMNRLGEARIPFLFVIDFAMEDMFIRRLDEPFGPGILYDVAGRRNVPAPVARKDPFTFDKFPESIEQYSGKFSAVQREIDAGNTYLLNLTCSTPIRIDLSLEEIFRLSHSPYRLLFRNRILCFSPEIFVRIANGVISSYPMKGTIDAAVDRAGEKILASEKEMAEHYTIVDLIRNDLSMVATGVRVERFRYIDRIRTNQKDLLQVSSVISGDLGPGYPGRIGDILFKLLPAGSVTGAPKKKTVEIIRATEDYDRGFYTGIFGISDGETLDSAVMIRYIEETDGGMVFRSGGGITSFSRMEDEYHEMIDKVYVPVAGDDQG